MKQSYQYVVTVSFNFHLVVVILLAGRCSCADPYYELCDTQRCGAGPNISYPFRIPTDSNSYCGYPGFQLNCNSFGYPQLRLHDQDYVVEDISYENSTILLYNSAFSGPKNGCFPLIKNYSGDISPFIHSRDRSYSYLHFLSDCNKSAGIPGDLERYKVECGNGNSGLVMFSEDENLGSAMGQCTKNVIAPVEDEGYDEDNVKEEYFDIMKRGFELSWDVVDCSECKASGGRCGYNVTTRHFECFCTDRPHSATCVPESNNSFRGLPRLKLISAVSCGVVVLLAIIVVLVCYMRRRKKSNAPYCWETKSINNQIIETYFRTNGSAAPKRFKYYEIKRITSSFKIKLGQGGFGSVFKGYLNLNHDHPVAVKLLSTSKGTGEDFVNELSSISNTSHVNVVKLLGFCFEYNKRALVYEYMPNGSLEKFIYEGSKSMVGGQLGWQTLFNIAVGIARGLEYLHLFCATRIVHFDIKPHNILLDEEFCPKISDFGLAKLCSGKESILSLSGARGTIGYIAPEVVCKNFGGVSHKSDVYSYGMMVLEMVGGRKNANVEVTNSSQEYFPHWIYAQLQTNQEFVLPSIVNDDEKIYARKMIIVSLWCIQTDPSHRPTMTRVVEMLDGKVDLLEIPPRPYLFSAANSSSLQFD